MIRVSRHNDKLNLKFDYDPETVLKVKTIKGRSYDVSTKSWNIPTESAKEMIDIFGIDSLEFDENVRIDSLLSKTEASNEISNNIPTDIFNSVLSTIEHDNMRAFAEWSLSILPKYFYEVPASSTGKYHPKYALGHGGLARHTKAAIMIANELFGNHTVQSFSAIERDCIRVALLLHDGVKHGLAGSRYVTSTHPLEVINYISEKYNEVKNTLSKDVVEVMAKYWNDISSNIATHMGEWNYDFKTKVEVLPKPETEMQKFTHLCDYLASRKVLEVIM